MEDKIRIIEVKRSIFADNDADAERLLQLLPESHRVRVVVRAASSRTTTRTRRDSGRS